MAEVTIRAHTRRGKGGKTIQVRGYSRRVGRKGVHSPKRRSEQPGEEYERRASERNETPELTPEEIAQRKEIMEGFRHSEEKRRELGMSREKYSYYVLKKEKERERRPTKRVSSHTSSIRNPLSPQGSLEILKRVEDSVAKFVEKYSGKEYKRQL